MARFDVYAIRSRFAPMVVDVQADFLSSLATRVVVPLTPAEALPDLALTRLKPIIEVSGVKYLFQAPDITSVLARQLTKPVANIEAAFRNDITAALDFLFQGF